MADLTLVFPCVPQFKFAAVPTTVIVIGGVAAIVGVYFACVAMAHPDKYE